MSSFNPLDSPWWQRHFYPHSEMKPTQDSERLNNLHRVTQLVSGKVVKKNDNILSCRGKLALSHCYVMKSKR